MSIQHEPKSEKFSLEEMIQPTPNVAQLSTGPSELAVLAPAAYVSGNSWIEARYPLVLAPTFTGMCANFFSCKMFRPF